MQYFQVVKVADPVVQYLFLHIQGSVTRVVLNIVMWEVWGVMGVVTRVWVGVAVKYLLPKGLEELVLQQVQMNLGAPKELLGFKSLRLLLLENLRVILSCLLN